MDVSDDLLNWRLTENRRRLRRRPLVGDVAVESGVANILLLLLLLASSASNLWSSLRVRRFSLLDRFLNDVRRRGGLRATGTICSFSGSK